MGGLKLDKDCWRFVKKIEITPKYLPFEYFILYFCLCRAFFSTSDIEFFLSTTIFVSQNFLLYSSRAVLKNLGSENEANFSRILFYWRVKPIH